MLSQTLSRAGAIALLMGSSAWSGSVDPVVGYVDGLAGPEDLVAIPGTHWIVAGGLGHEREGRGLYLIDRINKQASKLFPAGELVHAFQHSLYPTCPGVPDEKAFSAHGINLRVEGRETAHLYVVNHGDREAIEIFQLSYGRSAPELVWVGCVPLPDGAMANAVAPVPGVGIAATHFIAPEYFSDAKPMEDQPLWMAKLMSAQPTGYAATWSPVSGWTKTPGTEGSGPNGIEVTADGEWVWVAQWGDKEIVKISLIDNDVRQVIAVDFMPDNLRWGDDGMLWVAGASGEVSDYFFCVAASDCHSEFVVARINPETHEVEMVAVPDQLDEFGDATTAMRVDDTVWVGANPSDKVLYFTKPALSSDGCD